MTVVRMTASDLDAHAAALARAFQDDPLQSYTLPDPVERAKRSPAHFGTALRYGLLYGDVFTVSGAAVGAAIVLPPNGWEVTPERGAAAGFDDWPALMGADAAERFSSVLAAIDPYHHQDVQPAHYYVFVLGVAPEGQGKGYGRALLQPTLDRARAEGLPCYLETAQPKNVAFYQHLGFRVLRNIVEPTSGLPLWTFVRD